MEITLPSASTNAPDRDAGQSALGRILLTMLLLTIGGDYLFWSSKPGLSLGIFAVAVCAALLVNRPKGGLTRFTGFLSVLLIATAVQTAIEMSFTNVLVLIGLLTALVGETSFPG